MTIKPVFPAKRLGEQCFYRASCTFADQHSTCTQVQHNAVCDCEEGYHRVSLSRPSKKVFCAEGISCQPIRHTHALQYSQYTVPVAQITIQRKLDVNLDFSFSMVLRNCCVYTCGEDEIKAFRFFFFLQFVGRSGADNDRYSDPALHSIGNSGVHGDDMLRAQVIQPREILKTAALCQRQSRASYALLQRHG